jgi:hypothetical protein
MRTVAYDVQLRTEDDIAYQIAEIALKAVVRSYQSGCTQTQPRMQG